jgi:methyl-accepting chemotaxis protein
MLKPLDLMARAMRALATGALDTAIPGSERRDALGRMAVALGLLRDRIRRVRDLDNQAARLRPEVEVEREKQAAPVHTTARIRTEAAAGVDAVSSGGEEMAALAEAMAMTTQRASAQASTASKAACMALDNVASAANAAERLTGAIGDVTAQVAQSSRMAAEAVSAGEATRTAIQALTGEVEWMSGVAAMMTGIADRTNRLVLHATLEVARDGEAGEGFGVAALEVGQFAAQAARSAEGIGRHIAEMQDAARQAGTAVKRLNTMIAAMDAMADVIAIAMHRQTAAIAEMTPVMIGAATAARAMRAQADNVSEEVAQTAGLATKVRYRAAVLVHSVETLNVAVGAVVH